jgi:hypothetical protein
VQHIQRTCTQHLFRRRNKSKRFGRWHVLAKCEKRRLYSESRSFFATFWSWPSQGYIVKASSGESTLRNECNGNRSLVKSVLYGSRLEQHLPSCHVHTGPIFLAFSSSRQNEAAQRAWGW